jgi:hypothetical protein
MARRDYLRGHPSEVAEYSALTKKLAREFLHDIAAYVEGKCNFMLSALAGQGFSPDSTDSIGRLNRKAEPSRGRAGQLTSKGRLLETYKFVLDGILSVKSLNLSPVYRSTASRLRVMPSPGLLGTCNIPSESNSHFCSVRSST